MRDPAAIDDKDNWAGGHYELALKLGPRHDDAGLEAALKAVWRIAGVDGCRATYEPDAIDQPLSLGSLNQFVHLRGVVTLPTGHRVVCAVYASRDDNGTDWLYFYLPMEALGRTDKRIGGFPFGLSGGPRSLEWREAIDNWLADIARGIFDEIPFDVGLVGFETDEDPHADDLPADLPADRMSGVLVPRGDQLTYAAANR